MNLFDKIDELHANEVTPEEFKEVWGISIEDHLKDMMEVVKKQRSKTPNTERKTARKASVDHTKASVLAKQVAVAIPAAVTPGCGIENKSIKPDKTDINNQNAVKIIESKSLTLKRLGGNTTVAPHANRIRACKKRSGEEK